MRMKDLFVENLLQQADSIVRNIRYYRLQNFQRLKGCNVIF